MLKTLDPKVNETTEYINQALVAGADSKKSQPRNFGHPISDAPASKPDSERDSKISTKFNKDTKNIQKVPAVTDDRCAELNTGWNRCDCVNFARGGSYFCELGKDKTCKHVYHVRRAQLAAQLKASAAGPDTFVVTQPLANGRQGFEVDMEATARARAARRDELIAQAAALPADAPLAFQFAAQATGSEAFVADPILQPLQDGVSPEPRVSACRTRCSCIDMQMCDSLNWKCDHIKAALAADKAAQAQAYADGLSGSTEAGEAAAYDALNAQLDADRAAEKAGVGARKAAKARSRAKVCPSFEAEAKARLNSLSAQLVEKLTPQLEHGAPARGRRIA